MDINKCRNCKHHTCYYHGYGVGSITFSHRCWWTLKGAEKITEDECHYEAKENCHEQNTHI